VPSHFGAGAAFVGGGGGGSFRTQPISNRYNPMQRYFALQSISMLSGLSLIEKRRAAPVVTYSSYTPAVAPSYGGYNQAMSAHIDPYAQTGFCIFIYHLPPETDENVLYRLFGPFGAISSVKIVRDQSTGQCKGFGFVNFIKLEDSQQVALRVRHRTSTTIFF